MLSTHSFYLGWAFRARAEYRIRLKKKLPLLFLLKFSACRNTASPRLTQQPTREQKRSGGSWHPKSFIGMCGQTHANGKKKSSVKVTCCFSVYLNKTRAGNFKVQTFFKHKTDPAAQIRSVSLPAASHQAGAQWSRSAVSHQV